MNVMHVMESNGETSLLCVQRGVHFASTLRYKKVIIKKVEPEQVPAIRVCRRSSIPVISLQVFILISSVSTAAFNQYFVLPLLARLHGSGGRSVHMTLDYRCLYSVTGQESPEKI